MSDAHITQLSIQEPARQVQPSATAKINDGSSDSDSDSSSSSSSSSSSYRQLKPDNPIFSNKTPTIKAQIMKAARASAKHAPPSRKSDGSRPNLKKPPSPTTKRKVVKGGTRKSKRRRNRKTRRRKN